jgi:hypothetical protein
MKMRMMRISEMRIPHTPGDQQDALQIATKVKDWILERMKMLIGEVL